MGVNSLHWYYIPEGAIAGNMATLDGDEWHHAHRVLRLKIGDYIILCDGNGLCMRGIIRSTTSQTGQIELAGDLSATFSNQRSYKIHLGIAPTKSIDRTEFAVEKMVELGVDHIYFLDTQYAERSHLRMDRMQKIMIAAAKQSRKVVFPTLHPRLSPADLVKEIQMGHPDMQIIACHLDEGSEPIHRNYLPGRDVLLMIGPEGGFSPEEITMMKLAGAFMATLGPFRLRVETAAIAACNSIHLINEMNSHT